MVLLNMRQLSLTRPSQILKQTTSTISCLSRRNPTVYSSPTVARHQIYPSVLCLRYILSHLFLSLLSRCLKAQTSLYHLERLVVFTILLLSIECGLVFFQYRNINIYPECGGTKNPYCPNILLVWPDNMYHWAHTHK